MRGFYIIIFILNSWFLGSQSNTYLLDHTNVPLIEVLERLEEHSDFVFSYKIEDVIDVYTSCNIKSNDIKEVLEDVFSSLEITYNVSGNTIILFKSETQNLICGTIRDLQSKSPLAYANVYSINDKSGVSTNEDGYFELNASLGSQVEISYIGFQTKSIEVTSTLDSCTTYYLDFSEYTGPQLIIKDYITDGISLTEHGEITTMNLNKVVGLPGQIEPDILGSLQFLPGVSNPSTKPADLNVRGGTPDQNLILWDDIPIYHAAHYFGMIGALNPFSIETVDVYRGGFGPEFGGRISSVIALFSPGLDTDKFNVNVGSNMTNMFVNMFQPILKKKKTVLHFSLRRSYSELLKTPTMRNITRVNQQGFLLGTKELESLPDHIKVNDKINFFDSQIKLASKLSTKDNITAALVLATNDFSSTIEDKMRLETQNDTFRLTSIGGSISWKRNWNRSLSTDFKAIASDYTYDYNYNFRSLDDMVPKEVGVKSNRIVDLQTQFNSELILNPSSLLKFGYHLTNYTIGFRSVENENKFNEFEDQGNDKAILHAGFSDFTTTLLKYITLNVGARIHKLSTNKTFFLEPRIRLSSQLTDYVSIYGYVGRNHQFVSQVSVFKGNESGINTSLWALSNSRIPVQQGDIGQLGLVFAFQKWTIDVQGYMKRIDGLSSRTFDFDFQPSNSVALGFAKSRGVDVLLKKRFRRWNTWISYSLSKTDLSFQEIQGSSFPSNYDQRHVLQWSNLLNVKGFKFAFGMKYSSGLPYSEMIDFVNVAQMGSPPQFEGIYEEINNKRLKYTMDMNTSVHYSLLILDKIKMHVAFSIQNILNRENIYDRLYLIDQENDMKTDIRYIEKSSHRFTPNLSFRLEW